MPPAENTVSHQATMPEVWIRPKRHSYVPPLPLLGTKGTSPASPQFAPPRTNSSARSFAPAQQSR